MAWSRLSLSGRPPDASFQLHPDSTSGSFEPPPVKIDALFAVPSAAVSEAADCAIAWSARADAHWSGIVPPVSCVIVNEWHTRSQSSGTASLVLSVTAAFGAEPLLRSELASSSNPEVIDTPDALPMNNSAKAAIVNAGIHRKRRRRLLPVGPRIRAVILSPPSLSPGRIPPTGLK